MIYHSHQADREQGSLAAPFDGIHGWYFNNEGEQQIVIDLRVVGFYRLHEEVDDDWPCRTAPTGDLFWLRMIESQAGRTQGELAGAASTAG